MRTTPSPFFTRVFIFLNERIPPIPLIVQSLFFTFCIGLTYSLLTSASFEKVKIPLLSIFLGSFTLSLLIRVIDELKDKEDDKIHFPERCLPSGRVFYSDIKIIGMLAISFFIGINFFIGSGSNAFWVLLVYFFLFHQWFFLPKKMRKNLIIILITHNPIGFIIPFYFISILNYNSGIKFFTIEHFFLSASFWFPTLAWEVSRKIRSPEEESDYNTYSKKFGIFKSGLIPILSLGAQIIVFYNLFNHIFKNDTWLYVTIFFYFLYSLIFILFTIKPTPKLSNYLRPLTECYVFTVNLVLIINGTIAISSN